MIKIGFQYCFPNEGGISSKAAMTVETAIRKLPEGLHSKFKNVVRFVADGVTRFGMLLDTQPDFSPLHAFWLRKRVTRKIVMPWSMELLNDA